MIRWLREFAENVRIAGAQLRAHKMRSLLTALGVIIGVMAVTFMGTAVKGLDQGFSDSLDMLGTDILYVEKWPWGGAGDDWMRFRNRPDIKTEDGFLLDEIIANTPHSVFYRAVPGSVTFNRSIRHGENVAERVYMLGTVSEFALLSRLDIEFGRFFTDSEAAAARNVVVIGHDVADGLFDGDREAAVGAEVRIAGLRYEVIGVFARQGTFLGLQSFDNQAVLPLLSLRRFHTADWGTHIRVQMRPGATMEEAISELTGAMRRVRGLLPGEPDNFEINRTDLLEQTIGPVKAGIALGGFFITGLALFVGAIGIMNITFVSVRERTREIGTRRALGARRSTILWQFLLEAVSICLLGGLVGLVCTLGLRQLAMLAFPAFPFILSPGLILAALVVSVAVGILSGFVPAYQASRLDPAEALRHE